MKTDLNTETSVHTRTDWEELAMQASQTTLQMGPSIHDPLSARLLDDNDVKHSFDL